MKLLLIVLPLLVVLVCATKWTPNATFAHNEGDYMSYDAWGIYAYDGHAVYCVAKFKFKTPGYINKQGIMTIEGMPIEMKGHPLGVIFYSDGNVKMLPLAINKAVPAVVFELNSGGVLTGEYYVDFMYIV